MGIAGREAVAATQGGKQQGVHAGHKRGRALRQPGPGIARLRWLMRLSRVGERGHTRATGLVVGAPMGTQRHADQRPPGHNLDERPLRLSLFFARALGAVARCLAGAPRPAASDCGDGGGQLSAPA